MKTLLVARGKLKAHLCDLFELLMTYCTTWLSTISVTFSQLLCRDTDHLKKHMLCKLSPANDWYSKVHNS